VLKGPALTIYALTEKEGMNIFILFDLADGNQWMPG
jgi:hypothetical protein